MIKQRFQNTLYTNDNLFVLHGMNSETVDLIYLDPPFNSKRMYSAPVGSKSAGASFKDMWTWQDVNEHYLDALAVNYPALTRYITNVGEIHSKAMMSYLTYMAQRIVEMHRVLKSTGSLYLHCDPTASNYLKVLLDEVFGKNNCINEIVWSYQGTANPLKSFKRKPIATHTTYHPKMPPVLVLTHEEYRHRAVDKTAVTVTMVPLCQNVCVKKEETGDESA